MDFERSYMIGATARGAEFDQGLRSYMLGVYNYMATALAVTGFVALATAMMSVSDGQLTSFGQLLFLSPLKWVIMFAPLGMVFLFASRVDRMADTGTVALPNSRWPVTASTRSAPSENWSERWSTARPSACSGDWYGGVPQMPASSGPL